MQGLGIVGVIIPCQLGKISVKMGELMQKK